ncbi:IscA/HesB family protein [Halodesulfovibrio marinisediminis]|uniref:Fe-S cluster assembly iron-binding protein IscA n=1 Tax=Halodesulfovibrio marinisediminis DSM 17456 TaxID=1121457 RepID=A0A1N6DUL1_9BACT|nr:IscA/HesB family protein [Halodesulfovibrio marinisediminis]SIN74441.1 Fe-S cluster assembly iron-binding protein IscA [Halodesulfovibrio marinisediminis DSM 17456]
MFTLTDDARKSLDAHFQDRELASIRIYLAPGGCSGPRLALAMDEPSDEDTVLAADPYSFCINKDLLDKTGALTVDIHCHGFVIESENPMGGGCGSCGGGCGS